MGYIRYGGFLAHLSAMHMRCVQKRTVKAICENSGLRHLIPFLLEALDVYQVWRKRVPDKLRVAPPERQLGRI